MTPAPMWYPRSIFVLGGNSAMRHLAYSKDMPRSRTRLLRSLEGQALPGTHHIPIQRPLAEPSMFDYDNFIENGLPSDIWFSKLLSNDIRRLVRCRDAETGRLLLYNYTNWAFDMDNYQGDHERGAFYKGLNAEIMIEFGEVEYERNTAFEGAPDLALFEWSHLDQYGGTKGIEAWHFLRVMGKYQVGGMGKIPRPGAPQALSHSILREDANLSNSMVLLTVIDPVGFRR